MENEGVEGDEKGEEGNEDSRCEGFEGKERCASLLHPPKQPNSSHTVPVGPVSAITTHLLARHTHTWAHVIPWHLFGSLVQLA